jgi:DNA-binding LytR/AlgR family response regulator
MNPSCIIIDDEPIAINVLATYIEQSGVLNLLDTFTSPLKAFRYLQQHPVDVAFIDIEMPSLTGLQFIKSHAANTRFIITTAYREYALDGFDLEVADFMMKPISYDRFLKAVSKVAAINKAPAEKEAPHPRFIFVKTAKKMQKVFLDDILFVESQKDYLHIHATGGLIITRDTISFFEEWLPRYEFVRVHRSFIISITKIIAYTEEDIEMPAGISLAIGKLYKNNFLAAVKSYGNR